MGSQKRWVAIAVATVAILGGIFGSLRAVRFADRGVRRLADQLSNNARAQARSALGDRLKLIETQAVSAAQLPPIRGQIATFDAPTLKDGFRTEPWWAPFRNDFSVYGVANDGATLQAVEGMDPGDLDATGLIALAREHRTSSG
ncbi:MAG TPA: hypothetical protein VLW85_17480, partial [Myxococcales bacterium]|nr:hypothetical protein [Myxococcales bacterium]